MPNKSVKYALQICTLYYIYYGLLWYGYSSVVVPIYGGTGFLWEPNLLKIAISIILVLIIVLAIPINSKKASIFFLHFQLIFPILPLFVLFAANDLSVIYITYVFLSFIILVFISSTKKIRLLKLPHFSTSSFSLLLLLLAFAYIGSIILMGGLSYLNFDFTKVYEFRDESASNLPSIFAYFSPLVSKVILPFSFILAVVSKKPVIMILSICSSVLMFALTNHKAPLFYPFFAYAIYLFMQKENPVRIMLYGLIGLSLGVLIMTLSIDGFIMLGALFFHRMSFVPAQLNYYFFDFFSMNQFVYWAESKISFGLVDYAYSQPTIYLIGDEYYGFYGREGAIAANTGWLGAGYMNAGVIGMFLYALIIGYILRVVDAFSYSLGKHVVAAIMIAPMMSLLLSADLPNAMLTHGVLLALLLMLLMHRKQFQANQLYGVRVV